MIRSTGGGPARPRAASTAGVVTGGRVKADAAVVSAATGLPASSESVGRGGVAGGVVSGWDGEVQPQAPVPSSASAGSWG